MIAPLVQLDLFIQRQQLTVDASTQEPILRKFLQFLLEFTLTTAHDRRQDHYPLTFREPEHILNNLFDTLSRDNCAALVTVRLAD